MSVSCARSCGRDICLRCRIRVLLLLLLLLLLRPITVVARSCESAVSLGSRWLARQDFVRTIGPAKSTSQQTRVTDWTIRWDGAQSEENPKVERSLDSPQSARRQPTVICLEPIDHWMYALTAHRALAHMEGRWRADCSVPTLQKGDARPAWNPHARPPVESEFRATGLVQQRTGKEVTKRLPHVVVRWFPNCDVYRVPKTRVVENMLRVSENYRLARQT